MNRTQQKKGAYRGESEFVRHCQGFTLVESCYDEDVAMEAHAHNTPFLHIVLRGALREVCGRHGGMLSPGQVVFHPSGSPHATLWHAGGSGFAIQISARYARRLTEWGTLPPSPVTVEAGAIAQHLLSARATLHAADDVQTDAEAWLFQALGALVHLPTVRREAQAPLWLHQARDQFSDQYDAPPSLDTVAAQVGVHPAHLARAFRSYFGETTGDCIRRRRIEAACRRMAQAPLSLTDIAAEMGFADQAHFTRTFKRQVGMPPSEYARHLQSRGKAR